ncbi:MAG: hypothetical protein H0X41_05145 [Chitinophagaceae bacterium]|nr:hypothetical protein [Chitinophagaceae bacterium]
METTKKSTGIYWILFFLSVISFFVLLEFKGELLTLTLPFICTSFAKAMDIM